MAFICYVYETAAGWGVAVEDRRLILQKLITALQRLRLHVFTDRVRCFVPGLLWKLPSSWCSGDDDVHSMKKITVDPDLFSDKIQRSLTDSRLFAATLNESPITLEPPWGGASG